MLENIQAITANYAFQAKVIKQHNIAVIVNSKRVHTFSYNTGLQSL